MDLDISTMDVVGDQEMAPSDDLKLDGTIVDAGDSGSDKDQDVGLGEECEDEDNVWMRYNEVEELEAQMSDEERLQFFEEMLCAQQTAELWENRKVLSKVKFMC